jgi:DNA (cytosine-5)-methyltransferase 1
VPPVLSDIPSDPWLVLDLFSGAGGMSHGFAAKSEFKIIGAIDTEQGKPGRGLSGPTTTSCNATYATNIGIKPLHADLSTLEPARYRRESGIGRGELTVMIACAPCTGFSQKNALNHSIDDDRNGLVQRAGLWVEELRPEFFIMENVKELLRGRHRHHFLSLRDKLLAAGYNISAEVHNLADFGLPQKRIRALIVARRDNGPVGTLYKKVPRHMTVREAIGHLAAIAAGQISTVDEQHRAPNHNRQSMERIQATPGDGGSWMDIADSHPHLLIQSMKEKRRGSFPDIYGRLWWERPSITITRECAHPGNGRYLHPEQDRMLSVREMALLQGFPADYVFEGPVNARYNQIGDAVPPSISNQIADLVRQLKLEAISGDELGSVQRQLVLSVTSPSQ